MGQEFFINSEELERKVRQLLPSQGGAGAGVDLSASTQIVPIIDLTESAEGSNVRQDLQTAVSHDKITTFSVTNTTSTLINSTGYWQYNGILSISGSGTPAVAINDGATDKFFQVVSGQTGQLQAIPFDYTVFLDAGDSLKAIIPATANLNGYYRQIADIDGVLINP